MLSIIKEITLSGIIQNDSQSVRTYEYFKEYIQYDPYLFHDVKCNINSLKQLALKNYRCHFGYFSSKTCNSKEIRDAEYNTTYPYYRGVWTDRDEPLLTYFPITYIDKTKETLREYLIRNEDEFKLKAIKYKNNTCHRIVGKNGFAIVITYRQ
jgi:hypothetical protein